MKLFWLGMFWLAGIGLGRLMEIPSWAWLPPLILGLLSAALAPRRWRLLAAGWILIITGALRYQLAQPHLDSAHLSAHNDSGRVVTLTGLVVDFPDVRDRYIGLRVRAESIEYMGVSNPVLVEGVALVRASRFGDFAYGDRIQATGMLETPPVLEGFSYREYLARQGIYSLISNASVVTLAQGQANPLMGAIFGLRQRALETVHALYPDPEASLLAGILLGVESGIDPELRQAFNDTSTTHIIAISGFNITVLASLVIRLFGRWLGPRRGAVVASGAIGLYTLLVGADPAVVRAAIMGGLALLARLLGRQTHALASLSAAALAMTLANPLILWDVGFQLSFAATLGLVLYADPITKAFVGLASRWLDQDRAKRLAGPVGEFGLFTFAAQATTLPLTAYYFRRLSLSSLIANPVILPAQPPLMLLGGLATMSGMLWRPLGRLLAWIAWPFPAFTIRSVQYFAGWPSSAVSLGSLALPSVAFLYMLLFGATIVLKFPSARKRVRSLNALLPRPSMLTLLVILALLTSLTWREVSDRPDGRTHLTVLDLGSGAAVLIQSPTGRFVLVNGGSSPVALSSALGRRLPLFGRRIDWLVVGGSRNDQVAGLIGLVDRITVDHALTSGLKERAPYTRLIQEWTDAGVMLHPAAPGQVLDLGGEAQIDVLGVGTKGAVLLLTHGRAKILLADGADPDRLAWLADEPRLLGLTAYVLSNVGSSSRNPPREVAEMKPVAAVIVGDDRDLQPEPSLATKQTLEGTTILHSAVYGWIEFITDGERLWVQVQHAPAGEGFP